MSHEFELTYLAKYLPKDLKKFPHQEIIDLYIPKSRKHPTIRIRKIGEQYELTRKAPVDRRDCSFSEELTIKLGKDEYDVFKKLPGHQINKIRYYYKYQGEVAEFDIFLGKLKGLVTVEVEFKNRQKMRAFKMPDFCLVNVTQMKLVAGGWISKKRFADLRQLLNKLRYKLIQL